MRSREARRGLRISKRNRREVHFTEEAGTDLISKSNEFGIQRNGSLFVHSNHFLDLLLIFLLQTDCIQLKVQSLRDKGTRVQTRREKRETAGEKRGSFG